MFGFSTFSEAPFSTLPLTGAVYAASVTEASTAQDAILAQLIARSVLQEAATGTDSITALRALNSAVLDTATGTDSVFARAVFQGILQEIATLTDSVNAPGSTYSAPVVELATLQDAVLAAATFPTAVTEAATGTETNSAAFTPLVQIIETATITDEVSPPGSIYNPVVLAVAAMLDSVNAPGSIYNAPILESGTATVVLRRAKLNAISSNSFGGTGGVTTPLSIDAVLSSNVYGGIQASAVALEPDAEISGGTTTAVVSSNQASSTVQFEQITATVLTSAITIEVTSGWRSSATNGVTTVTLNSASAARIVTPYAVSTQNGPWVYRQINGRNLSSVRYVNGNFYAYSISTLSPNQLYRSADGFNWVQLQAPNPARPIRAIFGNGTQLIVQQNSTQIYLSTDNGATWATNTIAFAAGAVTAAVWDGTKYVYNNGRRIYTSTDGATWTFRYGSVITSERSSLAWNGAYFVAVFQGANSNIGSIIARSTNGTTWTTLSSIGWMSIVFNFGSTFAVALRNGEFYSLDPATNNYVALGVNTGYIYDAFAEGDYGVSFYNGEYILPAINLTAVNQLSASTDLVTFTAKPITFL
jgi:hypothetical protein